MTLSKEQKKALWRERFGIPLEDGQFGVALAGNPNVGKSTIFNALTGLRQHTGNWPGKTVDNAQGGFQYQQRSFLLVDLPGTYSLLAHTVEEQIARNFLCFAAPDVTIVVLDATCLERNLNLALQVFEITSAVIVCLNLMDEAEKKRILIDVPSLERELGVPVVAMAARQGKGLRALQEKIFQVAAGNLQPKPRQIVYSPEVEKAVNLLLPMVQTLASNTLPPLPPRWLALRLLDGDNSLLDSFSDYLGSREYWEAARWAE